MRDDTVDDMEPLALSSLFSTTAVPSTVTLPTATVISSQQQEAALPPPPLKQRSTVKTITVGAVGCRPLLSDTVAFSNQL